MLTKAKRDWKTLGRKDAERLYYVLKEVRRTSTMEGASFDGIHGGNKTKEIKEATELWRQSWIISPLSRVIAELKETYKLRN